MKRRPLDASQPPLQQSDSPAKGNMQEGAGFPARATAVLPRGRPPEPGEQRQDLPSHQPQPAALSLHSRLQKPLPGGEISRTRGAFARPGSPCPAQLCSPQPPKQPRRGSRCLELQQGVSLSPSRKRHLLTTSRPPQRPRASRQRLPRRDASPESARQQEAGITRTRPGLPEGAARRFSLGGPETPTPSGSGSLPSLPPRERSCSPFPGSSSREEPAGLPRALPALFVPSAPKSAKRKEAKGPGVALPPEKAAPLPHGEPRAGLPACLPARPPARPGIPRRQARA